MNWHGIRVDLLTGDYVISYDYVSAYPKELTMDETKPPLPEISDEKKKILDPWIDQFNHFDLKIEERISVLFGMALGYCHTAGVDFDALLGATLLAERAKQMSTENEEIEEG